MSLLKDILSRVKGESATVGLDIGNYAVKLVKIVHTRSGPKLVAHGYAELKPDTLSNGEIKNREALLEAITSLVHSTDQEIKDVVLSLSWSFGVLGDRIQLKSQRGKSDEDTILSEASQRPPFDVENITLDYKVLRRNVETQDLEVFLVAAKNQVMQSYINLLYDAGLRPVVVDVDAFAFANAYVYTVGEVNPEEVTALINIGDNFTNITFLKGGIYHSTRDVSTAGDYFVKQIQRQLKVSREQALAIVKGRDSDKVDPARLQSTIDFCCDELQVGIDLAFQYFQNNEKDVKISKIVLCGGGACIPGVPEYLQRRHDTQVVVLNPLLNVPLDPDVYPTALPETTSTLLTVAVGMALRKI